MTSGHMVASEQHLYQTIVLPRKLATGIIHDYLFCYYLLVGILFEVLRIGWVLRVRVLGWEEEGGGIVYPKLWFTVGHTIVWPRFGNIIVNGANC